MATGGSGGGERIPDAQGDPWTQTDPWGGGRASGEPDTQSSQVRSRSPLRPAQPSQGLAGSQPPTHVGRASQEVDSVRTTLMEQMASLGRDAQQRHEEAQRQNVQVTNLVGTGLSEMAQRMDAMERTHALSEQRNHQRFAEMDDGFVSVHARIRELEDGKRETEAKLQELSDAMAVVARTGACTRDQLNADEWDHEPDLAIMHVGAQQLISKQGIRKVLDPLLAECVIPCDGVEILGSDHSLARRWTISFAKKAKGSHTLAARRVEKVFAALRVDVWEWKELSVRTPTGGSARLFLNRDQSPQQGSIERHAKFARAAVQAHLGETRNVSLRKKEGEVAVDWHPLLRVFAPVRDRVELRWHPAGERACGVSAIVKESIARRFRELSDRIPEDEWRL